MVGVRHIWAIWPMSYSIDSNGQKLCSSWIWVPWFCLFVQFGLLPTQYLFNYTVVRSNYEWSGDQHLSKGDQAQDKRKNKKIRNEVGLGEGSKNKLKASLETSNDRGLMGRLCRALYGFQCRLNRKLNPHGTFSVIGQVPLFSLSLSLLSPDNLGRVNSGSSHYALHQRWQWGDFIWATRENFVWPELLISTVVDENVDEVWPNYPYHSEECAKTDLQFNFLW